MPPRKSTRDRIVEMRARGATVLQIAHRLKISPQAVYGHLARINGEKGKAS